MRLRAKPASSGQRVWDNVTTANNATFGYSPANRLTSGNGPWGTRSWAYDGVGNRTQEVATPPGGSATTDVYAYPGTSNRLATVTRGAQTVRAFTYDGAGNMLTDNRAGSTTTYTYNKRNRLSSATSWALARGYTYNPVCPPPAGRPRAIGRALAHHRRHGPHPLRARPLRRLAGGEQART